MYQLPSSVINRVPIELWLEIFLNLRTRPQRTDDTYKEQELLQRSVLAVSQTCSRFREITIGSPAVWTPIFVDFELRNPLHTLIMTTLWLDRSRGRPLSITLFNIPDPRRRSMVETTKDCLEAIFSEVPRWKEAFLSFDSLEDDFWEWFDDLISQPSQVLESLTVDNVSTVKNQPIFDLGSSPPTKLWINSPRLQKVVVISPATYYCEAKEGYCLSPDRLPQWVQQLFRDPANHWANYNYDDLGPTWQNGRNKFYDNIPYSQLTHFRLDNMPGEFWRREEVFRILTSCPKLIACSIEGILIFAQETEDKSLEPVVLQHLRHLALGCTDDDGYQYVSVTYALDYVTAPSLETLTIIGDHLLCFESYRNFLERSSCPIEEINFLDTPFWIDDLIPTLSLLPSLRAMHFHNIGFGRFISYNWDSGHSVDERYRMCPNLEQLSLSGSQFLESARCFIEDVFDTWLSTPTGEPRTFRFLIPSVTDLVTDSKVYPDLRGIYKKYPKFTMGFNDHMLVKGGLWDMYADR